MKTLFSQSVYGRTLGAGLAAGLFLVAVPAVLCQPLITTQPQSCTNVVGTTATFTVEATGTPPPAYQWQKCGVDFADLPDRTNATLVLTNVQIGDAADYRVMVTNVIAAVTSSVAHLYVIAPATIQFAASTYSVAESAGAVTLFVMRTNDTSTAASVHYTTADLTATNGLKYFGTNGILTFAPGETNHEIVVPILNEGYVEGTKSFQVILSNPTNATLGTPTIATVTIRDNDVGIQFQFANYNQNSGWSWTEDVGRVLIGVVRGDDGNIPVSVDFSTSNGSAISGVDYMGFTTNLTFAPQERLKFVPVTILNNTLKQPGRTFRATLSKPIGASPGADMTTTVTIIDNDQGTHCFETNRYDVAEDAGVVLLTVLGGSDDTNVTFTVDTATADGSATNGIDYIGLTNTLTFSQGQRRKVVPVPILNNGIKQGTRSFRVTLSNPTGGAVLSSPATATVYIQDNDPGLGFEFTSYTNPRGQVGDFAVTVVRGSDWALGPITVDYATGGGTAAPGVDYQPVSGTLKFEQNETLKSVSIPILRASAGKNFQVTLSNPTGGAALGASTTTVNLGGTSVTVKPPYDAGLAIRQAYGVNVLTWSGGGTLQRADRPTGPWQTLANATSPYTVQSPVPTSFYRVAGHRPVSVYVPSGYDSRTNVPLVIMLHGYYLDSAGYENRLNIQSVAESRGFLYCHPEGTMDFFGYGFWNGTDAGGDFYNSGVDDVAYLRGLIEEISRRFAVDHKRVHLFGIFIGGFMAYRMACQSSDLIAGIASLSGTTFLDASRCQPSEPVNILHVHATAEEEFFYLGGALGPSLPWPMPANMPPYPSAERTIQIWAAYNGARDPVRDPAPSMDLTTDVVGLDTVVTRYAISPPGGAVELWSIVGGTHGMNRSPEFSPRIIDWLLAHPKP